MRSTIGSRLAYQFLSNCYEPGDEIYLFGFSRGAYEARSLASFITLFGIARRGGDFSIDEAWATLPQVGTPARYSMPSPSSALLATIRSASAASAFGIRSAMSETRSGRGRGSSAGSATTTCACTTRSMSRSMPFRSTKRAVRFARRCSRCPMTSRFQRTSTSSRRGSPEHMPMSAVAGPKRHLSDHRASLDGRTNSSHDRPRDRCRKAEAREHSRSAGHPAFLRNRMALRLQPAWCPICVSSSKTRRSSRLQKLENEQDRQRARFAQ